MPEALGRYRIRSLLGRGGMGAVFEAESSTRHELVAIKTLTRLSPEGLLSFKQEFRRVANLFHPNLVRLYELSSEGSVWFFSMELIAGAPLLQHVWGSSTYPGQQVAIQGTLLVLPQLFEALSFLHSQDVLHLDIKPSNVLVTQPGTIKVLDFGLSEMDRQQGASDLARSFSGTPGYMAPEQVGGARTKACDHYALGATLFEAISGRLPFCESWSTTLLAKQIRPAPSIVEFAPSIPKELARVVDGLLARNPAERMRLEDAWHALRPAPPSGGPARLQRASSGLFGRNQELQLLRDLPARSRAKNVICRISGDSGVGKSCLLAATVKDWRDQGVLVLSSRCYQWEAIPFKAADALVDQLYEYAVSRAGQLRLPADLALASRMFPVLDGLLVDIPPPRTTDPQLERERASQALGELLAGVAEHTNVALCVDDAHWGDPESADIITQIVAAVPKGLVLILSTRPTTGQPRTFAERLARQIKGAEEVELHLTPLGADASLALARAAAADNTWSEQQLRAISDEAGGIPIFIEQVARLGQTVDGRPPTMSQVIDAYYQGLDSSEQALLDMVAIAERPTPLRHILDALGQVSGVHRGLAALHAAGLLRVEGLDEEAQVETYHDRIRQGAIARLSPARKSALHLALARQLENAGESPGRVAEHWFQAGELTRAAGCALQAAQQASDSLAFEQAAAMYTRALEWKPDLVDQDPDLLERYAWALYHAGRCRQAGEVFARAAKRAPAASKLTLQGHAAQALLVAGRVAQGSQMIAELLREMSIPPVASPRWRVLQLLHLILLVRFKALRLGSVRRKEPAALLAADVTWAAGKALTNLLPLEGIVLLLRSLLFSLRSGDELAIARGLCIAASGYVPFLDGVSDRLLHAAQKISDAHHDPYVLGMLGVTRSTAGHMAGEWLAVLEEVERAHPMLQAAPIPTHWEASLLESNYVTALDQLGDYKVLRDFAERASRAASRRGDVVAYVSAVTFCAMTAAAANDLGALSEAIDEIEATVVEWNAGYGLWNCALLQLKVVRELRRNDFAAAQRLLQAEWPLVVDALLLQTRATRCMLLELKAAVLFHASYPDAEGWRARLARRSLTRAFRLTARRDALPTSEVLRAASAFRKGKLEKARQHLRRASELYGAAAMRDRQCLVDWQLAKLDADDAARQHQEVIARELGFEDLAGWARYRLPGFATDVAVADTPPAVEAEGTLVRSVRG